MPYIYILQKKEIDTMFGEHKDEWVNLSWTANLRVAQQWRDSSHLSERRRFESLSQVTDVKDIK